MSAKTATLTVTNRPKYLRKALDACRRIDWSGFRLYIGLEPLCDECAAICEAIDFVETEIIRNETCLGINDNPFNLLERAFADGSEYNVYLEDDVLVSPDILDMTNWYLQQDLSNVMHLQFFQSNSAPSYPASMLLHDLFLCWGFVCTADQWREHIRKAWYTNPPEITWDVSVLEYMQAHKLDGYIPMFSRSSNIGAVGTNASASPELERLSALPHYQDGKTVNYRVETEVPVHTQFRCKADATEEAADLLDEFDLIFKKWEGCKCSETYVSRAENNHFWVSQVWTSLGIFHECIRSRYDLLGQLEQLCPTGIMTSFSKPEGATWARR